MHNEGEGLGHLLLQVAKLLRDRVHVRMEGIGLSRGQGLVLFHLGREEGLSQGELARQTFVRPATLTEVLQRMEAAGLVERRADPADARVSRVFLTEAGPGPGPRPRRSGTSWKAKSGGSSPAERAELRKLLAKLRHGLAPEEP